MNKFLLLVTIGFLSQGAFAEEKSVRWTGKDDASADLTHVLSVLKEKTGYDLQASGFTLVEDRDLARTHFAYYAQSAGGIPVHGLSLRLWTDLATGKAVQIEANVDDPLAHSALVENLNSSGFSVKALSGTALNQKLLAAAKARIRKNRDDSLMQNIKSRDAWVKGKLVRIFSVKGRRGDHQVGVNALTGNVVSYTYEPFPTADNGLADDEFSIPALAFPIYEEAEGTGTRQERIPVELKYLKKKARRADQDPYGPLRTQKYTDDKYDPLLGETAAGREQGFWAMSYIKREAAKIREAMPLTPNDFESGLGVIFDGRYATVSLHPNASKFTGLQFTPGVSSQLKPDWRPVGDTGVWEMIPMGSLLGRPLRDFADAWNRPARRLPDHDPAGYINDGFDELQVYYSVNTLFESLHNGGFTDPDLSTRPFNAFLYDPDIEMRDNAYYTDDTINFTTYSPKAQNYARDNSTIWHELGHGIMDRLMGDQIRLADTGGLSEGMADFVAALVIADVTKGIPFEGYKDFRIINKTVFLTANEVHDDGEAYGGSMKDLLDAAIAKYGQAGVRKVTDLTMETMRLTRNNPHLSAQDWFSHMLFADELGAPGVRESGELTPLVVAALAGRNFSLEGKAPATFTVKNDTTEVLSRGPGSRGSPIPVSLKADEKATYHLNAAVKNSDTYKFQFPVTIKVFFKSGPLQGAIHWDGEETEPLTVVLNSENDVAPIDVTVSGKCDYSNRDDGSCVDYAYIQVWNKGETEKPQAKKRFYLRVKTKE